MGRPFDNLREEEACVGQFNYFKWYKATTESSNYCRDLTTGVCRAVE